MGDGAGNLETGIPGLYWIRILGDREILAAAYCEIYTPAHGMHVTVEESQHEGRRRYDVVGRPDTQGWFTNERGTGAGSPAPSHHYVHEAGGADMINVGSYMLENVRATPHSDEPMAVYVSYGYVNINNQTLYFSGGATEALTAPAHGQQWALVTLNEDLDLNVSYGDVAWTSPSKPEIPDGELPVAYVLLEGGDTYIPANHIYDARPVFTVTKEVEQGDVSPPSEYYHIHVYQEDLSLECDGTKTVFFTANQYVQHTLNVFHNGHLLREGEGKDYIELWPYDGFEVLLDETPNPYDSLLVEYLVEIENGA